MQRVTIGEEFVPGANVATDVQLKHHIKDSVLQLYHASYTCKMGMRNDTMVVVDSPARVFRVNRLRVLDATAFPLLPPGHPQGPDISRLVQFRRFMGKLRLGGSNHEIKGSRKSIKACIASFSTQQPRYSCKNDFRIKEKKCSYQANNLREYI